MSGERSLRQAPQRKSAGLARASVWALLATFAASGCHHYSVASMATVGPGDELRVRLAPEQLEEARRALVVAERAVEGRVVEIDEASLLIEVPLPGASRDLLPSFRFQRLRLPSSGIVEVELKTLDRRRTLALSGLGAVALGVLLYRQFADDPKVGGEPPDPPITEFRGAGLRIPVGW